MSKLTVVEQTVAPGGTGLRQVAERAGISVAIASAVLNPSRSNTRFSESTRDRVLKAAEELRYQPNALARALTGQPTKTLGVLFGLERASVAVANPFVFTLLQGIAAAAAESRYNMTLFTEPWHSAVESAGMVCDRRTDGVIVIAPAMDSDIISCLAGFGIPVVSIATPADDGLVPSVDIDNVNGARLATEHLLKLGHRKIAHFTGDNNLRSAVERRDSFIDTMTRAGLPVPSDLVVAGEYTFQSGYDRALELLGRSDRPTAIFAASDNIAYGILRAARQRNLEIPDKLSVIGFDDLPDSATAEPPITTIRQPLIQIGEESTRLLLRRIKREIVPSVTRLFPPDLIIRSSTAPPLNVGTLQG